MSVKGYSDYEQLAGGVETLFKKSSKSVIDNASKAYQTAGMSANDYMETVTGFSAALIQSTGRGTQTNLEELKANLNSQYDEVKKHWQKRIRLTKDSSAKESLRTQMEAELKSLKKQNAETLEQAKIANETSVTTEESLAKAAKLADQAIIDMSDNANKMGTDMASIQNAYQGFSKQNYTMLDNLKLGYGGTKTEMERLLSDAQKISGIKYDVSSYADIVDAIHVVQTEMHISGLSAEEAAEKVRKGEMTEKEAFEAMGTTAKEASTTIQGSLKSAKSAWQNLLIGLSDDKADIDKLISNFFNSVVTVGENIIPRIGVVLNGITNMIEKLAPKITAKLPSIFKQILPSVVKGATSLLTAFIGILPELGKTITKSLPDFIASFKTVFKGIVDSLPSLVQTFVSALPTLIPQVVSGIVDMAVYLMKHISEILQPIIDNLPSILDSLVTTLMDNLPILIDGVISLVMGLVRATPQIIISLLQSLPTIIEKVISGLLSCLPQLIEGAIMLVIELVAHLPEIILSLIQAIPKVIESIGKALLESAPKLWNAFTKIFSNAWEKVKEIFAKIPEWFSDIFKNAVKGIKDAWNGVKTWFKNLWDGIWSVVKTPINWIIDGINSLIDGLNSLSIKIPDWVPVFGGQTWGVNIPKIAKLAKGGFVEGGTPFIAGEAGAEAVIPLENNNQWIYKFAHAFADGLSTFYDGDNLTQTPTKGAGGKVVNINLYLDNVNVKNDDDIEDVANKVSERIAEKLVAEGMAVG